MECLAVFLILVVVSVIAMTSFADRMAKRRVRRRLFQQLAGQFNGTYDSGGLFSKPSLRLRYGETWAVIDECNAAGPFPGQSLQVRIAWPHSPTRCEIIANFGQPLNRSTHTWTLLTADGQEFFRRFVISAVDIEAARQLLTTGVQLQIERLRKTTQDERLYVLVYDNQIVVRKRWLRQTRIEAATAFVRAALELYDQCTLAMAAGIEFLHGDEAQALEDVTCKVCGDSIGDDMVFCSRCKTPHHRDCWEYTGACSIYGCRETIFLLPQQSRVVNAEATDGPPIRKPR